MNTYKNTRHAKFLLNYHFIWTPKYRKSILDNEDISSLVKDTIKDLSIEHEFDIVSMEVMPDHIHLFISALPRYSPSQLMNIVKGTTGRRVSNAFPNLNIKGSIWSRSYFVTTAGNISTEIIENYINNQFNK